MVTIDPEDYLSPDAELRARWRAKRLHSGEQSEEFLVESNILGLYGELAVLAFVRDQLPAGWRALHLADSSATNSDISLVSDAASRGLEVKTTPPERLASYGRIVDEEQIYNTDAQAYVWCTAARSMRRPRVTILGWSTVEDVRDQWGAPTYTNSRPNALRRRRPKTFEDRHDPRFDRCDYDVDTDDYERLQSAPVQAAESAEVETADRMAQRLTASDALADGSQPLPGFVRLRPLARVTADIRSVRELIGALTGG